MSENEINPKFMRLFAAEAGEALQSITQSCLILEGKSASPSLQPDPVTQILRQAHSLKGAARALGLDEIANLTHRLETLFETIKSVDLGPAHIEFDLIYLTLERIGKLVNGSPTSEISAETILHRLDTSVENLKASKTPIPPPPNGSVQHDQTPASSPDTIRIAVQRLDDMLNLVNEMQAARLGMERNLSQMRQLLDESTQPVHWEDERVRLNRLYTHTASNQRVMSQILMQLQEKVHQARMLPLATVFDSLPLAARNLAQELGKDVALHIEGGDIEADRSVLEQIKSPLQHLLHNSIDHGLETPEKRIAAGKPATGTIKIIATQSGSSIRIEISDDGAGMDLPRVKDQAVRRRLLTAEQARQLDDQEAIWLLFQPGFSTAGAITTVSGRGMGLDIVSQAVESMHGMISVENRPGQGVCFSLSLPVSIATSACLLLRANKQVFALPTHNVARLIRIQPGQLQRREDRLLLARTDEDPIPAMSLADLMGGTNGSSESSSMQVSQLAVLLGSAEQPLALLVDEFYEVQEIVVKKLPLPFARIPYFSGASILGTGTVVPVLNATELIRTATFNR
ncbi:MAG: chemotaxis protein CheW [Saprospiraceae bacterium]|nr:chemotaxis protein CheW [Saprospiraceae bacterium]